MGNWNINIQGVGCHHNAAYPQDADRMTAEFVEALVKAGHTIETATFTYGGKLDYSGTVLSGKQYPYEEPKPAPAAEPPATAA